jgi:glycosyltransferase involved in cell wall biosynthesis
MPLYLFYSVIPQIAIICGVLQFNSFFLAHLYFALGQLANRILPRLSVNDLKNTFSLMEWISVKPSIYKGGVYRFLPDPSAIEESRLKPMCGVVIKVRDEQEAIKTSLLNLLNQTQRPFIVVVNDGSLDKTGEIASRYAEVVVNLPRHEKSWVGRPELAKVVNAGLKALEGNKFDFVMLSDGEVTYPSNYIDEITRRMNRNNIVLASGIAEGEVSRSLSPRGCGRVIDAEWFRDVEFKYPENYGFEVYLIYKALSQGKKVEVFPDLKFKLLRRTRLYREKAYFWGKGMKAINYNILYALARATLISLKSPTNGLELLRGYFSSVEKYEDIKDFVSLFQRKQLLKRISEVLYI